MCHPEGAKRLKDRCPSKQLHFLEGKRSFASLRMTRGDLAMPQILVEQLAKRFSVANATLAWRARYAESFTAAGAPSTRS